MPKCINYKAKKFRPQAKNPKTTNQKFHTTSQNALDCKSLEYQKKLDMT
jgi:hypothetical protein